MLKQLPQLMQGPLHPSCTSLKTPPPGDRQPYFTPPFLATSQLKKCLLKTPYRDQSPDTTCSSQISNFTFPQNASLYHLPLHPSDRRPKRHPSNRNHEDTHLVIQRALPLCQHSLPRHQQRPLLRWRETSPSSLPSTSPFALTELP